MADYDISCILFCERNSFALNIFRFCTGSGVSMLQLCGYWSYSWG